jgi:hypothetical protein
MAAIKLQGASFAAAATKSAIARFEYIDFLAESVTCFRARFVSFRARFERFNHL